MANALCNKIINPSARLPPYCCATTSQHYLRCISLVVLGVEALSHRFHVHRIHSSCLAKRVRNTYLYIYICVYIYVNPALSTIGHARATEIKYTNARFASHTISPYKLLVKYGISSFFLIFHVLNNIV